MNPKRFLVELKRRNVYKVAVAYGVVGWLLIEIATQVFPFFGIPNWAARMVVLCLLLGFPLALVFAWIYELTPEGLKRTEDVAQSESISRSTGRKLDFAIIAVLLVVIVLLVLDRRRFGPGEHDAMAQKSIAVLPFANMSDDKADAFFAEGVQDDILTALAKVADLRVISRTSVMGYPPNAMRDLRAIGEALGVAHVLEGSVRRGGGRVRVTAQLSDTRTNRQIWAESYDRSLEDVFAIQREIAGRITEQLEATLSPLEKSLLEEQPTRDIAAFDLFSRARTLRLTATFGPEFKARFLEAIELLQQAVSRDPSFLLAWCELAALHDLLYFAGYDHTPERLAAADDAVQTAQRLNSGAGATHLTVARHLYQAYRRYDEARQELHAARRLLPNSPEVFALNGYIDRRQGRWDQSTADLERAIQLDPRNAFTLGQMAVNYSHTRRYREAGAVLDRALAITPGDALTRVTRGWVELEWRADPRPLHAVIESIIHDEPAAAGTIAGDWLYLALCERDFAAADRALAALSSDEALTFGHLFLSRSFGRGLLERVRGNNAAAQSAFLKARQEQAARVQAQPQYAQAVAVLGLIDAALGHNEQALREGERAMELLPMEHDALAGADIRVVFAIICAWSGESERAIDQLNTMSRVPSLISYGQLKLQPWWDPLRTNAAFDEIVDSLAPQSGAR